MDDGHDDGGGNDDIPFFRLGAWQFLADLPYASVSLQAIWRMFWCLYSTPKDGSAPALVTGAGSVGGDPSSLRQETPPTVERIIDALKGVCEVLHDPLVLWGRK